MKSVNIEEEILTMLQKGFSYSEIESELKVSSKTIAKVIAIKKAIESNYNKGLESFDNPLESDKFSDLSYPESNQAFQDFPSKQIQCHDERIGGTQREGNLQSKEPQNFGKSDEEIRLEQMKLEYDHELRMKEFEWKKEKEEFEQMICREELNLEREKLIQSLIKVEEEKKGYIFRFRDLMSQCEPGEYDVEELEDLLSEIEELHKETKKFCYQHSIPYDGTAYKSVMHDVYNSLKQVIDNVDEDVEVVNWFPSWSIERLLNNVEQITL